MMVQSAPEGEPHFVITMSEHTALAGQFARAFGNDRFEAVEPRNEMIYLVDHHDHGWVDLTMRVVVLVSSSYVMKVHGDHSALFFLHILLIFIFYNINNFIIIIINHIKFFTA